MATMKRLLCAFLLTLLNGSGAFVPPSQQLSQNAATTKSLSSIVIVQAEKDDDDKFSFGQKIESTKTAVVGLLAGGIALTPFALIHDVFLGGDFVRNGLAQWEFDTDMGSIEAALFAIVYRYCIREDDNPMLNQGVIGAFVLVRALSKIQVPAYCSAVPLNCKFYATH